jgi:hypothetical protein
VSPDGGELVTNTWAGPELNVVDLSRRTVRLVEATGLEKTGGVAFNHGKHNAGLLAVHGVDQVAIFRWPPDEDGRLEWLAAERVEPVVFGPIWNLGRGGGNFRSELVGSLAWSTSGEFLVAAVSSTGPVEFRVWRVADGGRSMTEHAEIEVCLTNDNRPNDILTGNYPSELPTATSSATAAVVTPTATTGSTAQPLQPGVRLFLPAALRRVCLTCS